MHLVSRGRQYPMPGFPLQKWEIRHFSPNLACLHFQLQRRFCFVAMVQLNVRAETHERDILKISAKRSGDKRASSQGFRCTSRMMVAEACCSQRDHIARRAFPQNHPIHIQTHAPVATITHTRTVPSPTGLLPSARPSARVTPRHHNGHLCDLKDPHYSNNLNKRWTPRPLTVPVL